MRREKAVCLACGAPREAPKSKVFKDIYGRPMTFCNNTCYAKYIQKQPKA